MRRQLLFTFAALFIGVLAFLAAGHSAEPVSRETDPWVGEYFKYGRYDTQRSGQFGEARHITITKGADGYSLSKPYDQRKFTEIANGVLEDGKGGLGKIYLGSAKFADGKHVRILRAEFCYEHFILVGKWTDTGKKAEPKGK